MCMAVDLHLWIVWVCPGRRCEACCEGSRTLFTSYATVLLTSHCHSHVSNVVSSRLSEETERLQPSWTTVLVSTDYNIVSSFTDSSLMLVPIDLHGCCVSWDLAFDLNYNLEFYLQLYLSSF